MCIQDSLSSWTFTSTWNAHKLSKPKGIPADPAALRYAHEFGELMTWEANAWLLSDCIIIPICYSCSGHTGCINCSDLEEKSATHAVGAHCL